MLGEIEKAIDCFHNCLESGANVCLDRRLVIEAADGLQRAQVFLLLQSFKHLLYASEIKNAFFRN